MGAETSRLVPVMNGDACAGFLISLGSRGTEAFDKDEKSLGVFPDAISAASARPWSFLRASKTCADGNSCNARWRLASLSPPRS